VRTQSQLRSSLVAGFVGGLVVLALGAALLATDVIDTGETTREVVQQAPVTRPSSSPEGNGGARTVSDIYKDEGRGVVFIQARGVSDSSSSPFGLPQERDGTATGSGFVVDREGTIITNSHVVAGSEEVQVRFGEDSDFVDAEVAGRDPSTDLAVLKVDPDDATLVPLPLGDSSKVQVGDSTIAIGNPFGFSRTVTTGIVSALQRQIEAPNGFPIRNVVQTDAAINPGNSGGPLLDGAGRVIGVNAQIATGGSSGSVGIGFAIPVNTLRSLLPELKRGGEIERAYLGVNMAPVSEQVADDLKLPADKGALIQSVVSRGPAARAGLRGGGRPTTDGLRAGGDLIVRIDGKEVEDPDDVANVIAAKRPGERVRVEYFRGRERRSASVRLAKRPNEPIQDEDGGLPGLP
jgi:S1-C subfamily serine protease